MRLAVAIQGDTEHDRERATREINIPASPTKRRGLRPFLSTRNMEMIVDKKLTRPMSTAEKIAPDTDVNPHISKMEGAK